MAGIQSFRAVSISVLYAPIEVRELFALDEGKTKQLLLDLRENFDVQEAFAISTCNRTEVYYYHPIDVNKAIIHFLISRLAGEEQIPAYESMFLSLHHGEETSKYLFEMSIGLHSQVLGDLQIINQVKKSYQWCADVHMAGTFLHRIMHTIFYANKRVVQETSFRDGAASTSYAATELIDDIFNNQKDQVKILLIGAGEIGRDVASNLVDAGYTQFVVANRTYANAYKLIEEKILPDTTRIVTLDKLMQEIATCDVVVSAINSAEYVVTPEMVRTEKWLTYKCMVDLGMPRTIAPELDHIAGVEVYNLEELNKKTTEALQSRLAAIPQVKHIIAEALLEFTEWSKEMDVSPTIHKIKTALETIRQDELNRYQKQLDDEVFKVLDQITKNMMQKVMKFPVVQLKAACKRGDAENVSEILSDLFDLEKNRNMVHK